MSDRTISGGWTPYRPLTYEDEKIYHIATDGTHGSNYVPQEVSTLPGPNKLYRFTCLRAVYTPIAVIVKVAIVIHTAQGQRPVVMSITRI